MGAEVVVLVWCFGISLALNAYQWFEINVRANGQNQEIQKLQKALHWKDRVIVDLATKLYESQEFNQIVKGLK